MPQSFNLTKSYPGLNPAVQSIRVWLFPGPPFEFPRAPNSAMIAPLPQVEVAVDQAHFVVYEGFTGRNQQNGTSIGRGSIDTSPETAQAHFNATTLEELLVAAFPAPGTDN